MSLREQFYGGVIKSIQRGTISATNGGTGTVTVSSVNTAKSILQVNNATGVLAGSTWANSGLSAGATLTNATTITWKGGWYAGTVSTDTAATLYWQLVEYN